MHGQRGRVDHTVQVHVQGRCCGLEQLAVCVRVQGEVVCARADACVCKDKVEASMGGECGLEQLGERGPLGDVGLHVDGWVGGGRRVDVCADDGGA